MFNATSSTRPRVFINAPSANASFQSKSISRADTIVPPSLPRIATPMMAKHTSQKLEKVEKDVERDFIMNAEQSKDYGIIDEIIWKHK